LNFPFVEFWYSLRKLKLYQLKIIQS
jgi:hypothetical protein